ncbi:hypothetical protein BDW02DRAFT_593021 [Decorospora gaudefroyi]|uniref:HTH CENPB-type domain-containing protein n=1 Tax=Decorospora gaudefroyi TaxID=184978 RepID=A0A6A5K5U1_9PLEO|nr:hypothetical protein BDW02DRAFT_593021 [Decorospora gaudefroyi]
MDPIQEAIEDIESRGSGYEFSYGEVAKKFNVNRTTLSRRHQGKQTANAASGEAQRHLNPQQEQEFVRYTEKCTRRGLPPKREMLQNFTSAVAKWEVSHSWVTRFMERWDWRERHDADSKERYELYFALLHKKMRQYDVNARDTYNMDEKGFFIGRGTRSKSVFTKRTWALKERTATL